MKATLRDKRKRKDPVSGRKVSTGWDGPEPWEVRWRMGGKRPAQSFATWEEARKFKNAVEGKSPDEWVDPNEIAQMFEVLAASWWEHTLALRPHTRRGYHRLLTGHVEPFFKGMPQNSIQWLEVQQFVTLKLAHPYDPGYVRDMLSVVRLIFKFAINAGLRTDNPANGHPLKVRKRKIDRNEDVLNMDEALMVVAHIRDPYKPLFWLLMLTGMRPAEACGLLVRHIDFERMVLHVEDTINFVHGFDDQPATVHRGEPKTEAGDRFIPLDEVTVDELATMLNVRAATTGRRPRPNDPLFESIKGGKPLIVDDLRRRIIVPALKGAGISTSIRTYDIRHSHATLLIDEGATLGEVAERLGHVDELTAIRLYYHLTKGRQREMTDILSEKRRAAEQRSHQGTNVVKLFGRKKTGSDDQ